MLELPESVSIARELNRLLKGSRIENATVAMVPHKFAFYEGDPTQYPDLLQGQTVVNVSAIGGYVELQLGGHNLILGEYLALRFLTADEKPPTRHQLLLQFNDGNMLSATVKMFGAIYLVPAGTYSTQHHMAAAQKPSPLTPQFDYPYFSSLTKNLKAATSVKAFLATEQRIPGLGNGVMQDILFDARINPKVKLKSLSGSQMLRLHESIKNILAIMTAHNGRDTERDVYGNPGAYVTVLSAKTCQDPCPRCGGPITKLAYMGGTVYFCPVCQPL